MKNHSIINKLSKYKDDELRKIIYIDSTDYVEETVDEAKTELFSRYDINIWEADELRLGQLIQYCTFDEVIEKLIKLYTNEEIEIAKYELVFNKLIEFECFGAQEIRLFIQKIKNSSTKESWDIHGIDITTNEKVELRYCKWSEWVRFLINKKQLQITGKEVYVALCLKEMTSEGFDEEEISEKFMEIQGANQSIEETSNIKTGNENTSVNSFIYEGIKRKKDQELKFESVTGENNNVRPWIRYFARSIDLYIWFSIISIIFNYFASYYYHQVNSNFWANKLFLTFQYFIWVFIEAILLSKFGASLGKWILNVYVRDEKDHKLTYGKALKRAFYVFLYGEGLYIPLVLFVTNIISYRRLTGTGKTKWDEYLNISVSHKKIEWYKAFIAIIILVVIPVISYVYNVK